MMVSRLYFVIVANEFLKRRMAKFGSDMASLLTDDQLWSAKHHDRSNWSKSSLTVAVKLMYLAHLRNEYSEEEECAIIFESFPITEATFDKWWTVTPLEVDETLEDVASDLNASILAAIAKTGVYAVDQWIESLKTSPKITHTPVEFNYDELLDLWIAETVFLGQRIKVRLYCRKDSDFSNLAKKAISDVSSHWELLKNAIVSHLLPQYNEESNQGFTADEFFTRLVMKTIDFDAKDIMYTLFWSDSGLFGGHSIKLLWDPEEQFQANVSLVG